MPALKRGITLQEDICCNTCVKGSVVPGLMEALAKDLSALGKGVESVPYRTKSCHSMDFAWLSKMIVRVL